MSDTGAPPTEVVEDETTPPPGVPPGGDPWVTGPTLPALLAAAASGEPADKLAAMKFDLAEAMTWVAQQEVALRDGRITWTWEERQRLMYALRQLGIKLDRRLGTPL